MSDDHRELIAKDIVDQLRLHKPQFTAGVCSRAIQEITRLRAENAELRAKLDAAVSAEREECRKIAQEHTRRRQSTRYDRGWVVAAQSVVFAIAARGREGESNG